MWFELVDAVLPVGEKVRSGKVEVRLGCRARRKESG